MNLLDAIVPPDALRLGPPADTSLVRRYLNGLVVPPAEPIALGGDDLRVVPWPDDPDEFDGILIHAEDQPVSTLDDIAGMIAADLRRLYRLPGPLSWRRWEVTGKVASLLYTSGITRSGGGFSMWGADQYGAVHHLPSWRSILPRRGDRLRPYVLFRPSWWWECHVRQGWQLRGRHRPARPFAFGICARCMPCRECGAAYECEPGCAS